MSSRRDYPEIEGPEIEASAQTAPLDDELLALIEAEGRPPSERAGSSSRGSPIEPPPVDDREGAYTYAMLRAGPAVPATEVETRAAAVEVVVRWGQSVLHVAHLSPPRAFVVGEEGADYSVPKSQLGADSASLVLVENGRLIVVAPPSGTVEVFQHDGAAAEAIDLLDNSERRELTGDERAVVHVANGLTFEIKPVLAGRVVAGHVSIRPVVVLYFALSAILHGGWLAAMFFLMPALQQTDENGMTSDQSAMLKEMVKAYAEREEPPKEVEKVIERKAVEAPPPPAPKAPPPKQDQPVVAAPQRKSMPEDIYRDFTSPNAAPAPMPDSTGGGNDLYDDPGSEFGSPGGSPTGTGTGTGAASGTGTGTAEPVAVAPKVDLSKPASVVGTAWNCPFPAEADAEGIDNATATIVVTVGNDGSPRSVSVVSDPGTGFGRAARQCALGRRYTAGLDRDGNATTATTPPIRVRFSR